MVIYTYVTETRTEKNPEPFLERDPAEIIMSGDFQKVPWILGTVENEGALKAGPNFISKNIREEYTARFDELGLKDMLLDASVLPDQIQAFWMKMKQFYLNSEIFDFEDEHSIEGFTNVSIK